MRKSCCPILAALMVLLILFSHSGVSAAASPAISPAGEAQKAAYSITHSNGSAAMKLEGDGTPQSPYLITSKEQLSNIRNNLSASYLLQNDILFDAADFEPGGAFYRDGMGFLPIGTDSQPFTGQLDGDGHTIHGLVGGLFGYMDGNGKILNLNMEASEISGISANTVQIAGGIVSYMLGGLIRNCSNAGAVHGQSPGATNACAGGIAGYMLGGTISDCRNSGSLTAYAKSTNVGGIAALAAGGTISNCINSGKIVIEGYTEGLDPSDSMMAGGIAAYSGNATIANCANNGDITAEGAGRFANVGGIIGYAKSSVAIHFCSNTGDIRGSGSSYQGCYVGGIAGMLYASSSLSCVYNTGEVVSTGIGSPTGAGGVAGRLFQSDNTISDSFNTGSVHASNNGTYISAAGGMVGCVYEGTQQIVANSYNAGTISASDGSAVYIGAIIGDLNGASDELGNCYYWDKTPHGVQNGDDTTVSVSNAQLKRSSTFSGFDFSSLWTMAGNTTYPYPELKQIPLQGKFVTSIAITNQEDTLEKGQTLQMHAMTQPDDADDISVRWTIVAGTGNATISQDGLLSATGIGTVTVVASTKSPVGCYDERQIQIQGGCTVTFDAQGGSSVARQTVRSNALLTRPADPTRTGATFLGWYKEAACTTLWNFATDHVTADMMLFAKWNIDYYVVSFDCQGGSAVSSQNIAPNGRVVQPVDPALTGNYFAGWYQEAGCVKPWDFTTAVTSEITLYAKWTPSSYPVTLDYQNGNGSTTQYVTYGDFVDRPAKPLWTGHAFVGWYKEAACVHPWDFAADKIAGARTLYAKWVINTYKVVFDSQGGSAVASQTIAYNAKAAEPNDPVWTGRTFAGWYQDAACTHVWTFATPVTAARTLYAKWTINTYRVTFDSQGGNAITGQTTQHGARVTQPTDPTWTGHTFAGWYQDVTCTHVWNFATPVTASRTLYAKWTTNTYRVTFDSRGGSDVAGQTVAYNATVTPPADPARTGYSFAGWYHETDYIHVWNFAAPVTANRTLYARWNINSYRVTFDSQGGSATTGQTIQHGARVTQPADPSWTGHTFAGWYRDVTCSHVWNFTTPVTASRTLYAKWTTNTYRVTFDSRGGNAVASQTVMYGHTVSLPANPKLAGYTFAGWYREATCNLVWHFDTAITAGRTLYAKWTVNSYPVTFDSRGGSAVAGKSVQYHATVTRPADPTRTGHTFAGWYRETACTHPWNFATDTVRAPTTLFAKWQINSYRVYFYSNNAVHTMVTAAYGDKIDPPMQPKRTGYTFAGWYKEVSCTHPWYFAMDTVDAPTTLFAKWTINRYRVCFYSNNAEYDIVTANYGDGIDIPTQPKRIGYTFAGWYKESACIHRWSFFTDTVKADTSLYAKWTVNTYSVSFDGRGGTATGGRTAVYGATITAPADPVRFAYTFKGWFKNASCTVPWNFATDTVGGNTTLYAGWTAQPKTAFLNGIALSCGSLDRAFDPSVTRYTINLRENDSFVTITPIKYYDGAAMTIDRKTVATKTITLGNGRRTTMTVRVTWNRKTTTYRLTIKRPKSTDNTLAALTATAGVWSQAFDPAVSSYTLTLPKTVSKVTLKATKASALTRVSPANRTFRVKSGKSVKVTFKVRAQSGAVRVYTVTIVRP